MQTLSILFYPTFLLITFIVTLIFIPKKDYKSYFIYGFLVGGAGDVIVVGLLQNILHLMWFKNLGIFNVLGQMALSPPSWTVTAMIFLYFLPNQRRFLYPYVATWAGYSVVYAYVVRNVGLYDFVPWLYPIPAYFLFLGWWSFSAWLFIKTSPLVNDDNVLEHVPEAKQKPIFFKVAPQPARKVENSKRKIKLKKPIKLK